MTAGTSVSLASEYPKRATGDRPRTRWPLRVGLISLAALVLLVVAALFGGPRLLDLSTVQSAVERKLSQAANGRVAWNGLRIRVLPSPRVEMRGVTIDVPGRVLASIEQAQAGLRLRSLLHGQVEFAAIAVVRPVIRVDIPPSAPEQDVTTTDPIAAYRSALGAVAQTLRSAAPGALLEISNADVLLRGTVAPELRLRNLSLRVRPDSTGFDVEASAAGNLWDRLNLVGRVEFADLSGSFDLDITRLDAKAWLDDWFSGGWLRMGIPRADVRVRVVTDARNELRCDIGIDAASLRITHAEHGLPVSGSRLRGTAVLRAHDIEVAVSKLQIGSLIPAARGTLLMNSEGQAPRLELDLPKLDVTAVRDFVMALVAPESPSVQRHATRALGGAIAHLKMRSQGDSWHELIRLDHLEGAAELEQASLLLPFVEREARELRGRIALAHATVELVGASARVGPTKLSDSRLRYSMRDGAAYASIGFDLDLPQALAIARSVPPQDRLNELNDVESTAGRLQGRANLATAGPDWNAGIEIAGSDASVRVHSLPWPVSLQAARASISPRQVRVSGLWLTAGRSTFADIGATLALEPELRLTSGSGRAMLALDEIYPWLRSHAEPTDPSVDVESVSGSVQIDLNSLSGALAQPSALAFDAVVLPAQIRIAMKQLPGPLTIAGGAMHVDPTTVRLDGVGAALLDAQALVSGEIENYRGAGMLMRVSSATAVVGQECAQWIWQRTAAPAQFEPRAPLRVAVERATWRPKQAVEAQGSVTFEEGPELTADLRWEPDTLDVRHLVIRDKKSDAAFGLRAKADLLEASFAGSVDAQTIAALFRYGGQFHGRATGDLRVTLDLEHRGRSAARGAITAQALDLDELLPVQARAQARVDRLDLRADGSSLQIRDAALRWAQQVVTIHGRIARENQGVFVDVQLDSPGIQIDALTHRGEMAGAQAVPTGARSLDSHRAAFFSWLRAMAASGRVRLRSNFVEFEGLRLAPVTATLTFTEEQAELRLQDTQLCGLSVPMTMQIAPAGYAASAQIRAQKQQVEEVARCLTDQRVLLTGEFDARADLRMNGDFGEHLTHLKGTVHLESRKGTVRKFALIGNILAMTDVSHLFSRSLPDLRAEGFPYRTLDLDGHLDQGRLFVEDFTFDSSAFGLAATGSVGLVERDTQLNVLVAPFSGLTNRIRKLPIIGSVLGGTLTSIPVAVRGDIRDPTVVPLDPRAVASDLIALFTRALGISKRMLAPLPSSPASATPSAGR